MFKNEKKHGAQVPEFTSLIPMPHIPDPQNRRIKTIVKHCTQTEEFDKEVNAAISNGWILDDIRPTSSESMVMLFALLHRYEERENHGKV